MEASGEVEALKVTLNEMISPYAFLPVAAVAEHPAHG